MTVGASTAPDGAANRSVEADTAPVGGDAGPAEADAAPAEVDTSPVGADIGTDQAQHVGRARAEELAGRLMAAAGDLARCEATFLTLLGEFDAAGAIGWWYEDASLASWLSRTCGFAPGTAREHVRVARALRGMPATVAAFEAGEVSYSKVRELTRLAGTHDEARLLSLARAATASQLARTVQAYRAHTGAHAEREARTKVSWSTDADGTVRLSAVLLPDQGAAVVAALEACADLHLHDGDDLGGAAGDVSRDPTADPEPVTLPRDLAESFPERSRRSRVEALVEIANHWLDANPEDRSGEDRTTVLVEVDAALLIKDSQVIKEPQVIKHSQVIRDSQAGDEPDRTADGRAADRSDGQVVQRPDHRAGSPVVDRPSDFRRVAEPTHRTTADRGAVPPGDVPAGTSGRAWVRGFGNLEPDTVRRMCCEAEVQAIVTGMDGEPLHVGRALRFGTRAQRRALMLRDGHCAFPACGRVRRLKVHHIVPWTEGGPTDLANLMLLCQHHHTMVHEAGITVTPVVAADLTSATRAALPAGLRWVFARPDGSVIVPEVAELDLANALPRLTDPYGNLLTGEAHDEAVAARRRLLDEYSHERLARETAHQTRVAAYQDVHDQKHPDAAKLYPVGGGEGFGLHNCVEVLFSSRRVASGTTDDTSDGDCDGVEPRAA